MNKLGGLWYGIVKLNGRPFYVSSRDKSKAIYKLKKLRAKLHGEYTRHE